MQTSGSMKALIVGVDREANESFAKEIARQHVHVLTAHSFRQACEMIRLHGGTLEAIVIDFCLDNNYTARDVYDACKETICAHRSMIFVLVDVRADGRAENAMGGVAKIFPKPGRAINTPDQTLLVLRSGE